MAQAVPQAVVLSIPSQSNLTVSLSLGGRERHLDRPKDEPLSKALGRLQKALSDAEQGAKGKRKKKEGALQQPAVQVAASILNQQREAVDPSLPNDAAWQDGFCLQVGEASYQIIRNPPTVHKLSNQGLLFTGVPICPVAELLFADEGESTWEWLRGEPGNAETATQGSKASESVWQPVSSTHVFTPGHTDINHALKIRCTPAECRTHALSDESNGQPSSSSAERVVHGEPAELELGVVQAAPEPSAGAGRHALTQQPLAAPHVRIVTYNILADQYASQEHSQKVLFSFCPSRWLDPDYRRPLVLQELLGYHADVICLQEVDETAFSRYFQPQFHAAGYDGTYANKAGSVREGEAMFWRRARYRAVTQHKLRLQDFFRSWNSSSGASTPLLQQIQPMLMACPSLAESLCKISTVAQLVIFTPTTGCSEQNAPICLANTHLFFHPLAVHIRTLSIAAILETAHSLIHKALQDAETSAALKGIAPSFVLCGDLNSDLRHGIPGAIEIMRRGQLFQDHWEWDHRPIFSFGAKDSAPPRSSRASSSKIGPAQHQDPGCFADEKLWIPLRKPKQHNGYRSLPARKPDVLQPVHLTSPFGPLRSADDLLLPYTNYVRGYQGLLDYIFLQPGRMEVKQLLPIPSCKDLASFIPSLRFPSDHIAVVAELTWRSPSVTNSNGRLESSHEATSSQTALTTGSQGSKAAQGSSQEAIQPGRGRLLEADLRLAGAAASMLRDNRVLAVPTDTLYGLAACAGSSVGLQRLYDIKKRPAGLPLGICVGDVSDVGTYGDASHLPDGLLEAVLPGPVTLILPRHPHTRLSPLLNPGLPSLGIRVPDSDFIREICRHHQSAGLGALALTSANLSGGQSSVEVLQFQELWSSCTAVFDAGKIEAEACGSTILELCTPGAAKVVRAGINCDTYLERMRSFGLQTVR
ncbi:hypothetical protein WJX74_008549 [Apatococcus lobatus]|uniref:Threonylcarbamoyl-AMP synthase n=1 Tax=Apatococcus lobatus TaxID=904363 RepID=A0AAW1QIJ2_9CHLO